MLMPERRYLVEIDYYACRRDVKPDITILEIREGLLEFLQRNMGDFFYTIKVLKELV
jgi:hypothetical protein